jgi:uncharacterized protein (DUF362 family)
MSKDGMTRREFIKRAGALGAAAWVLGEIGDVVGLNGVPPAEAASEPTIAVASRKSPAALVRAVVDELGGMSKFVRRGATVLVKPNIAWARKPEQAATTNPEVVAEVIRLCRKAGAREVKVIDHAIDRPDSLLLKMTGLGPAAQSAGARVFLASSQGMYQRMKLARGEALKSADVLRDLLRADVFINVPIAKVHSATGVTLGCKNLMGVVWDRGAWHRSASLDGCIAEFAAEIKPQLVILDAVRVLTTNGPKGPGRVENRGIVVAGTDPLAVDAYGVTLLGRKPEQIAHLTRARALGVGELDLTRVKVKNV